jgi:hypothetical protein
MRNLRFKKWDVAAQILVRPVLGLILNWQRVAISR